jgi:hypothetical protein
MQELLKGGWKVEDINAALGSLEASGSTTVPVPLPHSDVTSTTVESEELPGVFALAGQGWGLFTSRFKTLVSILLVSGLPGILVSVGNGLASLFPTESEEFLRSIPDSNTLLIAFIVGIGLAILIAVILNFWGVVALMHAVNTAEDIGPGVAFKRALPQLLSYGWLVSLMSAIAVGVFFVGLVIPGALLFTVYFFIESLITAPIAHMLVGIGVSLVVILFYLAFSLLVSTWMNFSLWLLIEQKAKGLQALIVSRQMVYGRFWAILGRTVGVSALIIVPAIVGAFLIMLLTTLAAPRYANGVETFVGQFITLIITPIILAAFGALYARAKQKDTSTVPAHGKGFFISFSVLGVASLVLLAVIGMVAAFYLAAALPMMMRDGSSSASDGSAYMFAEDGMKVDMEYMYDEHGDAVDAMPSDLQ